MWAFGTMSPSQEKDYVTAKLQMVAAKWTGLLDFSQDTCRLLMRYITTAQVQPSLSLIAACSQVHIHHAVLWAYSHPMFVKSLDGYGFSCESHAVVLLCAPVVLDMDSKTVRVCLISQQMI